jgi:calcineurin-like phosphoesterase family protein
MANQIWFTADTHFGHANIIKYCSRPFHSAEEMNQTLIQNINDCVHSSDTLFHLGDWSFGHEKITQSAEKYIKQIHCKNIIIIHGNHDPHYANGLPRKEFAQLFAGCYQNFRLQCDMGPGILGEIFMFHYACRVWDKSHHGSIHLFGHSHGTLSPWPNAFDVGVDKHNYKPVSLPQVADLVRTQNA